MSPPDLTLLVVSHTHWDREWYHRAERFRQRLVPLIDELLDDPPVHGTSFLLDGQAILLDDYLVVRPERASELSTLLRDGRLEAGPWYVLPDELIPTGEALVRNLLAGRDAVRRLRGEPPPVLYCPDSFGHPAILPELAAGFGCALVVLWRGFGGSRWPAVDTLRWRGASGQTVVLHHLPPDGYEFGSTLPVEPDAAAERWRRLNETLSPRAVTGCTLLLNGADHHARQLGHSAAIAALACAAAPARVQSTSLRCAAGTIVRAAHEELPVIEGELRDSYGYTWTLAGTLGTRAAQKRRNAIVERLLLRDTEPWLALTRAGGEPATRALLWETWRTVLRAHPHDTLCGTSIDAVSEELDTRLARAQSQAEGLRDDALATLAGHDHERARERMSEWRAALLVRNPVARTRCGVAEVMVATPIRHVSVGPGSADRQGAVGEPESDWVERMGVQCLSRHRRTVLTEAPRAYPVAHLVEEVHGLAWVGPMGGYSLDVRFACSPLPAWVRAATATAWTLDNGALRVEVSDGGRVQLTELGTGRTVHDLLSLEVRRDVGDLYTPALREELPPWHFTGCTLVHTGPLRGELALEYRDPLGASRLAIHLQLDAGLGALCLSVHGHNALRDARLRLCIGLAVGAATTVADAAFHPIARTPLPVGASHAMEQVVPTAPLHRFVSRYGAEHGGTVISDGLAEYESLEGGGVAVTLLRAVGTLSRHDLPERPGHAGWPAETPGAQVPGAYEARLAIALHGGDTPQQRDAVEHLVENVLLPICGATLRSNLGSVRTGGGLELLGEGLAFSAAAPARRSGWIVLRCVNRRGHAVDGAWRLQHAPVEACLARLDETPGEALPVRGSDVPFTAPAMEIVTVLVRVHEGDRHRHVRRRHVRSARE